jgi:hypothetical protein
MGIEHNPARAGQGWPTEAVREPRYRWYHKAGALVYIFFCFELGVFLLLFPWLDLWEKNYFSTLLPWSGFWNNDYVRGAVSGLGLMNIAISFSELLRLRRFSGAHGGGARGQG